MEAPLARHSGHGMAVRDVNQLSAPQGVRHEKNIYLKIRVLQRILDFDPPLWAKRQTLLHQVNGKWVRLREQLREGSLFAEWQRADVFTRTWGRDSVEVVKRGRTQNIKDDG